MHFMAREHETVITVVTKGLTERAEEAGTPCLVVLYGDGLGKRYFLEKAEQIIGRSDAANIQVNQESVSRRHALLVTSQGRTRVRDLGSTNGTFVNDEPVEEMTLRDGDLIRIGQTIFKYLSGSNIESKYHEEIYRLTTVDGLTQTYNKRYFLETLEREVNRALRYGRNLSLILFDIDHFKRINDTHGHLAGDQILRDLASLVQANLRREDVFARYGGEEFAVILPESDRDHAVRVSEKLRALVEERAFSYDDEPIPVTISLGVASIAPGQEPITPTELVAAADAKLYEAKEGGRNRVVY